MRFSIVPQEGKFFESFNEHAAILIEGARTLCSMLEDWGTREESLRHLKDLEHQADAIVHDLEVRLNKTFVTPVDREDIHELAGHLDDIIDSIHGSAVLMDLYRIGAPTPACCELAAILEKSVGVIAKGVEMLPTFKEITPLRKEMQQYEKEGDRIYRGALGQLFVNGGDPLFVIKWKEIYENLETAIDSCEDVYDVLEGIVLKHA